MLRPTGAAEGPSGYNVITHPLRQSATRAEDELIVAVHGFAGKRLWMHVLCSRLRSRGCRVSNWGYASLCGSIAKHAQRFHEYLVVSLSDERRVHIVAHSMGAIIVRAALSMGPVANLGRVVLLAPPNTRRPQCRSNRRTILRSDWGAVRSPR